MTWSEIHADYKGGKNGLFRNIDNRVTRAVENSTLVDVFKFGLPV
jgi:hypothetical protein